MFSFSKLGKKGNLGNQLFEIASVIGLADKHEVGAVFPPWEYATYFQGPFLHDTDLKFDVQVREPHYHYADLILDAGRNVDLLGWFQSEKYWKHCEDKIKSALKFQESFYDSLKLKAMADRTTVAISIRRGDYVGNENYHQLSLDYYLTASLKFPGATFMVFSDDIKYCKANLPTTWKYMEGFNAIQQLAIGSMCDHFIIANSSFSWWMAYLGEKKHSRVIAPAFWNAGPLLETDDDRDVVPKRWERFNPNLPKVEKIDLSDVAFTIPVKNDHPHRRLNLELSLSFLQHYFKTNILISEMDHTPKFEYLRSADVLYRFYKMDKSFERTRMLNDAAKFPDKPIIVNWDCDVFMKPQQILEAVQMIRDGKASGVYPYDGRFFRCDRNLYFEEFRKCLDVSMFSGKPFKKSQFEVLSVGGAIVWNRKDFIAGGMENENMIHYGPEDRERYDRFVKLGYKMERIKGALFHIDHDTSNNGSQGHDHSSVNDLEYEKIKRMNANQLRAYIKTWPWANESVTHKQPDPSELYKLNPDQIYCLTLAKRTDRHEHVVDTFENLGIDKYRFWTGIDGNEKGLSHFDERITPGMIGCYESHKDILKNALDNKYNCIIIFEDDIKPMDSFNEFLKISLPKIPKDWQFVYLGCTEYGGKKSFKQKVNQFWVVPNCAWGTQAFMVRSREAIQKLYDMLSKPQKRQIDEELANHILPESGLKYYSIYPSIVSQEFEKLGSDVQKRTKQNAK